MKKFQLCVIALLCPVLFGQAKSFKDTLKYQFNPLTIIAKRYNSNLIDVPFSVTVISKDEITGKKGAGIDEALSGVPGVVAQSRAGGQDVRITIRGFGARGAGDRSNAGTSRGVRVMIDGIPETEPDGRTSFDMVELGSIQNIEVIRSNTSSLWGNSSGGIINLSTVPLNQQNEVGVKALFGSYGFSKENINFQSVVGSGSVFGSLNNSTISGWRNHSASKKAVVNLGVSTRLDDNAKLGVFLLGSSSLFHIPGPLSQAEYDANPQQANALYLARDERRYNRLGRIGVNFEDDFSDKNSLSTMIYLGSKYLQRSERNTFRDFNRYHTGGNISFTNITPLSSKVINKIILGVDEAYQDGNICFYSLSPTNFRGTTLKDDKREGANNFGVFLQNELTLNELSFLFGARYDKINYISENFLDPSMGTQQKSFERITPKFAINYKLSSNHSVFFSYGGGVEVPAGNETDPSATFGQDKVYLINPLLEPIVSSTIEIGTKSFNRFENSKVLDYLSYETSVYLINITNDIVPYSGGKFYFTAGKTQRIGFETAIAASLFREYELKVSATLMQSKYKNYIVDSVHYKNPGKYADYAGNKVAGVPDLQLSSSIKYSPKCFEHSYISVSGMSSGKYFVDDANKISVAGYFIVNASIGTSIDMSEKLNLGGSLSINNLTNRKYAASAFINPDVIGGAPVFLEAGLPRNYTASLFIKF